MRIFFWIVVFFPFFTKAQNSAKLHVTIKNPKADQVYILNSDYTKASVLFGERTDQVALKEGKASWEKQISKPGFINIGYPDYSTKEFFSYALYLSPGDSLNVSFDAKKPDSTVVVQGKGYRNSQPLIQKLIQGRESFKTYKKDSLPYDFLEAVKLKQVENQEILQDYIERYNPDQSFVDLNRLYVTYYPLWTYLSFKGGQKFSAGEAFKRNESKWQAIEDSLTRKLPMNNTELFAIPDYVYFLPLYLTRIKEYIWSHEDVLQEYYGTDTQEEALKLFNADRENLLMEKIINKRFKGKTAEFLYATLFKGAINEKEDNLPEIFSRFTTKFPHSEYIPYIEPAIKEIEEKRTRKLTDKMLLVEHADSYKTFEDVLELVKGKTVLLDMWGTWCGPCRKELSLNSEFIKSHFKNSDLEYLYISNYDLGKEKKWKELIAYYNLEGTHILASQKLTEDIMKTLERSGFPTYAIIKEDGTFEVSKAGYPMDREVLIDQLENALK